jgi:hypothetical protein
VSLIAKEIDSKEPLSIVNMLRGQYDWNSHVSYNYDIMEEREQ